AVLLGCEDSKRKMYEVVVKLRGREMTQKSQIAELVTALLAHDLGLDVPRPAVVDVPAGFETIVTDALSAAAVKGSSGPNFGSLHLGTSFTGWPNDRTPIGPARDQAAAIFAFDALVQNVDRRAANPNLWSRSDTIGVFDHEQAFAFLYTTILGDPPRPWCVADQAMCFRFLEQHVFYPTLRRGVVDLDGFEEQLGKLTKTRIAGYLKAVPKEWRHGHDLCEKIGVYLSEARKERTKLIAFLKHLLR
ncbi:MAG: HipA family kinase, partial [Opitutaceae bacterium]